MPENVLSMMTKTIVDSNPSSAKKQKLEMHNVNNIQMLTQLPTEILTHCFEFLTVKEILIISSVNSTFNEIGQSQVVWKSKCQSCFSLPNIVLIEEEGKKKKKIAMIGSGCVNFNQLFVNTPNDCSEALVEELEETIIHENARCKVVSKFKHQAINNILKRWSETIELLLFDKIGENEQYWYKKLFKQYYEMYISGFQHYENIEDGCKRHSQMRKLLNQLEVYLSVQAPSIADSISFCEGENLLKMVESKKEDIIAMNGGFEFAQLYLLTDGQSALTEKDQSLFGGYDFYDYEARLPLLEYKNMIHYTKMFKRSANTTLNSSYPVVLSSYCSVLCAAEHFFEGDLEIKKGTVYQMSGSNYPMIISDSFSNWFEKYVNDLTILNMYDIEEGGVINRFPNKMYGSETVTEGVKIYCQSLLIPELSRFSPDEIHYYFSYRIKITMDKNESAQKACKLVSRHWEIYQTSDVQNETPEIVDGPGVIGLYPKISPGTLFTYNSCTETEDKLGYMKGYFTMKRLCDGRVFNAMIDLFPIDIENHI